MSDINSGVSDTSQLHQIMAAYKVAQETERFDQWAMSVKLDPEPLGGEKLPEFLRKQVEDSRLVPAWIFKANAPEYKHIRRFFPEKIIELTEEAEALGQLLQCSSPDQELSDELKYALPDIFRVASQHFYFQLFVPRPTETDRRRPMDQLNDHAWQLEGGTDFLHRIKCPVQLPHSADFSFSAARADSAIFLRPNITYPDAYNDVLHWANQFRRGSNEMTSKRQVWMTMVSGLYQRRALGFDDHYVYGTAHHSQTQLTIYAGAWDNKISQDGKLSIDAKIILYELCTLDVLSPVDMVQFYLLMRLARHLALQYKDLPEKINFSRLLISLQTDEGLDSWPPPESQNPNKPKSSTKGSKRSRLSEVEEEHNSTHLSDCSTTEVGLPGFLDTKNNHSVHVVDPLKHQFADILSRKGEWSKVRGYLASSMHQHYDYQVEEINEQVQGADEYDRDPIQSA
ncbi:hypothetical protein RSOLAG22IIIB_05942 [Rhizoctonia solani]|uniref:Uncharacterized protein n=1 Tax=Rhizoctonia solani TaxID=456999 RepID=A0A0K6GB06_9AGAM|nr:hypothetical protein RSOLAG22IIIB_05942 [Rhizoctonia solani]